MLCGCICFAKRQKRLAVLFVRFCRAAKVVLEGLFIELGRLFVLLAPLVHLRNRVQDVAVLRCELVRGVRGF